MLGKISDIINKVSSSFNNDPFMSMATLNRNFEYKIRKESETLKFGQVKPCY